MNKTRAVIATTLVVVTTCLLFSSCNRKPNKPVVEELTNYRVWFVDIGESGKVKPYAYHPTTRAIDTFDVDLGVQGTITVSADGSLLYLSGGLTGATHVWETDSLHFAMELPYGVITAVSRDGNYISAIKGDGLYVLRTSDYSVVFHDSVHTRQCWFTTDSRTLYSVSDQILKVTFTDTGQVVERKPFNKIGVVQIVPTPDGSKWLMYSNFPQNYTWIFEVYDVALDSIIFAELQIPGGGHVAMTPDGKYGFYGNPGTLLAGPPFDTSFTVFDIKANVIERVVPTQRLINGIEAPWPSPYGEMVVTPDNRWLVLHDAVSPQQLFLYDLKKEEWVDYHHFGTNNVALAFLTVQIAP